MHTHTPHTQPHRNQAQQMLLSLKPHPSTSLSHARAQTDIINLATAQRRQTQTQTTTTYALAISPSVVYQTVHHPSPESIPSNKQQAKSSPTHRSLPRPSIHPSIHAIP
ncbi:uncharacterized protein K452DRAFT_284236 [Aplosporella prunicola CBS 121167]|uniref:Uncharacterized protein n=1 Tax=Aplosporella prunicola CBS 121167 TaxID=1176127 RepID=A0A6A6BNJ7_9PEZI|nr:uncharacterized protein K452DRAFT_284236 [Aplosporella prunicola CBS 121167]KAF2144845.1 hypothetical protein K452DRAFT_284236 [Aplosporella prunicola CBS 121167]